MTRRRQHRSRRTVRRRRVCAAGAVVIVLAAGGSVVATNLPGGHHVLRLRAAGGSTSSTATTTASPASPAQASSTTVAPSTTSTTVADPDGGTGVLASPSIDQYLGTRSGDVTAAVEDLHTGKISLWNPAATDEYTASIVKVDILGALLQQAQTAGQALTSGQQELAETMIEDSDDDSASSLWTEIGEQSGLAAFDSRIGLEDTTPGSDDHWGGTTTTAADQLAVLRSVVETNAILSSASRTYELQLMEDVDPDQAWGVSSGPSSGTTVAIKNGWLPLEDDDWQVNSIGWVDGSGRDYLVAVLTKQNDTEGYGIDTIEGLSSLLWQQMSTT